MGLRLSTSGKLLRGKQNVRRNWRRRTLLARRTLVALLPVDTGRTAISLIQTLVKTYPVNFKFFFWVGVLCASPWIKDVCFLFDPHAGFINRVPQNDWYYVNWHWFLSTVDDPLKTSVQFLAVFFLFPARFAPAYFVGIPLGDHVGTIIWYCFCTSPKEVNTMPPTSFALMGIALTIAILFSYEYLVHRYYHRWLRCKAALLALYDLPGTDKSTVKPHFITELNNAETFQSRF